MDLDYLADAGRPGGRESMAGLVSLGASSSDAMLGLLKRVDLVLHEVNRTTGTSMRDREELYAAFAYDLNGWVTSSEELMNDFAPVETMEPALVVAELRLWRSEIVPQFATLLPIVRGWFDDGGADREPELRRRVDVFEAWWKQRMNDLRSRALEFRAAINRAAAADSDRQREVAQDWSVVDADGWA